MKNLILCAGISIWSINLVQAQSVDQTHTTEQRAFHTVQQLSEKVSLLTQQKKDTLVIIFKDFYDDMKIYRAQQNEKMIKAIEQTRDERVQALLGVNQFIEYKSYMAELKAQYQQRQQNGGGNGGHHGHRHGGGGAGGGGGMNNGSTF